MRSMRKPCNGDSHVCRTIRMEKVTWISARLPPVAVCSGLTNRVQTYCGLEIAIMATTPNANCSQRREPEAPVAMMSPRCQDAPGERREHHAVRRKAIHVPEMAGPET